MESPWGCVFYDRMQLSISENSLLFKKKKKHYDRKLYGAILKNKGTKKNDPK